MNFCFKIDDYKNWDYYLNILKDNRIITEKYHSDLIKNCFNDDRFIGYLYFDVTNNKLRGYYNDLFLTLKIKPLIKTPKELIELINHVKGN